MTIESATYIADLNPSYPAGSDAKSEGDNHIRLLKTVLQASILTSSSTPTLTNVANVSSSNVNANDFRHIRIGNYVVGYGSLSVLPTASSTVTQCDFSLPISSNLGVAADLVGVATIIPLSGSYFSGYSTADVTNNRAAIAFVSANTSWHTIYLMYAYKVI